jgi:hypothetical protein
VAGVEADVAAEARDEIGVAAFAAGWPAAEDGADAALCAEPEAAVGPAVAGCADAAPWADVGL